MMSSQKLQSKVRDHMTANPVTLEFTSTLKDAVDTMARRGIGNLVVTNGASIGILTEREILNHLNLFGHLPNKELCEIVLRQFTKVSPDTSIADAAKIMISSKTRLLVYDGQKRVGIITASDLVRAFYELSDYDPAIEKTMSKDVFSLESYSSILDAVRLMDNKRIGSVIVTTDGLHDGIFTERDLLTRVLVRNVALDQQVGKYCSPFMVTAREGIRARAAAKVMLANGIKRLPITSKGRAVGIITARDLVETYTL